MPGAEPSKPILDRLWQNGTLTLSMSLIMQACMRGKFNILVCANADAGKAELVEALCACIGSDASSYNGIIADCSSLERAKLLQVLNNRSPGSILTTCAESPGMGLLQLEALARQADPTLSGRELKGLVLSSIGLVIQTAHMTEGTWFAATEPTWRVTEMSELIWSSDDEAQWGEGMKRNGGYA